MTSYKIISTRVPVLKFVARHVTCATVQTILLLISLLVPQSPVFFLVMLLVLGANQFYWSSRYLCHSQTNFVAGHAGGSVWRVSEVPCADILAMIFSLWNKQRWLCVYYAVRMLSKRLMKTKSTSYQNWTNKACCLMNLQHKRKVITKKKLFSPTIWRATFVGQQTETFFVITCSYQVKINLLLTERARGCGRGAARSVEKRSRANIS